MSTITREQLETLRETIVVNMLRIHGIDKHATRGIVDHAIAALSAPPAPALEAVEDDALYERAHAFGWRYDGSGSWIPPTTLDGTELLCLLSGRKLPPHYAQDENGWPATPSPTPQDAAEPACLTCGGNGWIGGPSFYAPDEGGEPCPDCNAAVPPDAAPPVAELLTDAARDVLAERRRQIEKEGWTPEHDDEHNDGSLASVAACYACGCCSEEPGDGAPSWPPSWDASWWRPKDNRRNLVKAGALILADIERLDRIESATLAKQVKP